MATLPLAESDPVAEGDLAAHEALSTGVHGIADTAELATKDEVDSGGVGLEEETKAREDADSTEEAARKAADDAEAKTRGDADTAEAEARKVADEAETSARAKADEQEREAREDADAALAEAAADAQATADAALPVAGGTMAGDLVLHQDPDAPLKAATRQFVLAQIAAAIEDLIGTAPEALDTLGEVAAALKAAEESEESALEALTALVETKMAKAANGSDIQNAATFRSNLGLGSAATHAAGDFDLAGAAAAAQAASQPLSSILTALALTSKVEAFGRELLELATAAKAREKLGLGTAATKDAGAAGSAGGVLNADDPTTSDSRTPKAHAASHKTAGSDPLAASDIGAAATSHTHAQSDVTGLVAALEGKQASLGFTPENVANKDTDTALAANSDTKYPSQKAVKAYIDGLLAASDAVIYIGAKDCSGNPKFPAADAGHLYRVSVAGKIGGSSGTNVEVGDTLLCNTDGSAEGTQAEVGSKWNLIQANIDGAVVGPASATSTNLPTFSGTTGKILQDSGVAISTDGTMASNSDAKTPTEKATKTYADTKTTIAAVEALLPKTAVLTSNVGPINEQTALQDVTGLVFDIAGTEIWKISYLILVEAANATMDLKLGFSCPAGTEGTWGVHTAVNSFGSGGIGAAAPATAEPPYLGGFSSGEGYVAPIATRAVSGGASIGVRLDGVVIGGGTKGKVQIKFAQNTKNSGNLSILKGSWLEARKLAS